MLRHLRYSGNHTQPYARRDEVNHQLQEMLANVVIRPSNSPWNAPVLLVKKNSLRFVCDFRSLNDVTIKDTYPLPRISEIVDKMDGTVLWTTLDAASAYWSIPLMKWINRNHHSPPQGESTSLM